MLLVCIITFLRYIKVVRGASNSTYETLMVHTSSFLLKTAVKFHEIDQISCPLSAQEVRDAMLQGEAYIAT